MKSNNKVITGKIFDNLLRISWALLLFAIKTLTEFLDIKQIIDQNLGYFFVSSIFWLKKKRKLILFTVSIEEFETTIINL